MHELSIASALLETVQAEAACHPGAQLRKVGVRIGELAAIDPEALRFSFEVLTRDAGLEALLLEIEMCPRRHRCPGCGTEFVVREYSFQCPACGSAQTDCIAGDELELCYLEMDEHEPSAVATKSAE